HYEAALKLNMSIPFGAIAIAALDDALCFAVIDTRLRQPHTPRTLPVQSCHSHATATPSKRCCQPMTPSSLIDSPKSTANVYLRHLNHLSTNADLDVHLHAFARHSPISP
ncbi:MAG: hypothetical protein OSB41_12525, partial [Kiritimatiellae bacterium]|nr:hypothetical protein [Kiritimatiellia bacterium]